jgi:hypothetical protein
MTFQEFAKLYAEKNRVDYSTALALPHVKLAYLSYSAVRVLR